MLSEAIARIAQTQGGPQKAVHSMFAILVPAPGGGLIRPPPGISQQAVAAYRASSVARVSLITVTLIWPG
jgi:hypothetical protein